MPESVSTKVSDMSKYLSISLSIAVFLIFSSTLFLESLNLPSFDDYDATIGFIKQFYFDSDSIQDKFEAVFSRHNEHRILFSKLISASYFSLFENINFSHLIIIQNLFLLLFFLVTLLLFKRENQLKPTSFLIITALLFNLSFWQVSFYYWAGVQHYPVFLFSFLTLIMLDKADKVFSADFVLGVLFAFFAVFSFGNGFLALLTGMFLLFAKKNYTVLSVWIVISLALIFIAFFVDKHTGSVTSATFNIGWMARLLFTFAGSFLYINPPSGQHINIMICMGVGAGILAYWLWLFFSGYAFRKPLLYALLSLPILSGIIISISRFETKAAGGIAPRYMFFTSSIPILLLLILSDQKIISKKILPYFASVALIIWSASYYNNSRTLKLNNQEIRETLSEWQKNDTTRLVYYHPQGQYTNILRWAIQQHVVSGSIYESASGADQNSEKQTESGKKIGDS